MPAYIYLQGAELSAFNFESITVAATAVGFTAATITPSTFGPAQRAVVTVETAQVRYRIDAAPTATVGHILNAGDVLVLEGINNINSVRFIRTGATNATIMCTYERIYNTSA